MECMIFERVHCAVCGPIEFTLKGEARYFFKFIEEFFCWVAVYPIDAITKVLKFFQKFLCYAERSTGKTLKALQSNGGGEYVGNAFQLFFARKAYLSDVLLVTLRNKTV